MITNKKKVLLRNALLLACLASMPEVYAQDLLLANNQLSKTQSTKTADQKVPLANVLQNLQQQYHVSFLYETQNLEGKHHCWIFLPSALWMRQWCLRHRG